MNDNINEIVKLPNFEAIRSVLEMDTVGSINLPQAPEEAQYIGLLDNVDKAYLFVIGFLREKAKTEIDKAEETGEISEGLISSLRMAERRIINLQEELDCRIALRFPKYRNVRYLFTPTGVYIDPVWEQQQRESEKMMEEMMLAAFGINLSIKPIMIRPGMSKEEMIEAGLTLEMMEKMPKEVKKSLGIE